MDEIRISVALVTRNRPESLKRCLESWRSQSAQPYEIVVSDDSDEELAGTVKQIAEQYSCVYTKGPRRGLYANRNHAALTCTGTHVLSADDDHSHPAGFFSGVMSIACIDENRVWTFAERNTTYVEEALTSPPELHRSGAGCAPADPNDSTAIADGATLYPRRVFIDGLRFDETYPFGPSYLLWGKQLRKGGWRISYASRGIFHWHHGEHDDRLSKKEALARHLEAVNYAVVVNALYYPNKLLDPFSAFYYIVKRMLFADSIVHYTVQTRIGVVRTARLIRNALAARHIHGRNQLRGKVRERQAGTFPQSAE